MMIRLTFILLILIIPVSAQYGVEESQVYTYSGLLHIREFENGAPVSNKNTEYTKAVRIDEITDLNTTVRISEAGKRYSKTINATTIGQEVVALDFDTWRQLSSNHSLLQLPAEYDVGVLLIETEEFGNIFTITVTTTVEGSISYILYFALVYDMLLGVRTLFTATVREDVGGDPTLITTVSESLISTTDKFPTTDKGNVLFFPIILAIIVVPQITKRLRKS